MKPELITTLLKVQKELPVIGRSTKAYNYKYAPLEHIWEQVEKVISSNGFVVINELTPEGIITKAIHASGELTSFISYSHHDLKPQDRGSEITYGRRYNLTAIFNIIIVDEDDDGAKAQTKITDAQATGTGKATAKQLKFIRDLLAQKGYTEKQMETKYEVTSIEQLTYDQASQAIEGLLKLKEKPKQTEIDVDQIDKEINK